MADHLTRLYERNPATGGLRYADDDTVVEAGDVYDTKRPNNPGKDSVVNTLREAWRDKTHTTGRTTAHRR